MTRKAFEGYDEPVKIDMDPEEALSLILHGGDQRNPGTEALQSPPETTTEDA